MTETTIDYVTKSEFRSAVNEIKTEMRIMESHLSKQITIEVRDTYWKIIPITISIQLAMSSLIAACMFFIARAM